MPLPAWWHKEREGRNARSKKQERDFAKKTGGRTTRGSGSSHRDPGDVKVPGGNIPAVDEDSYLIEAKYTTDKKGFTITRDMVALHLSRSRNTGREPAFAIEFVGHPAYKLLVVLDGV